MSAWFPVFGSKASTSCWNFSSLGPTSAISCASAARASRTAWVVPTWEAASRPSLALPAFPGRAAGDLGGVVALGEGPQQRQLARGELHARPGGAGRRLVLAIAPLPHDHAVHRQSLPQRRRRKSLRQFDLQFHQVVAFGLLHR